MFYYPVHEQIKRTFHPDSLAYRLALRNAREGQRRMKTRLWPQSPNPIDRILYLRG